MKKKIISALLSISIVIGMTAIAENPFMGGSLEDGIITFECSEDIILNGYEDGVLAYSKLFKSEDGKIVVPEEENIKLYDFKAFKLESGEVVEVAIGSGTPAAPTATPDAPSATTAPDDEPLETPAVTPTPAPYNPNEFPAVYEKALNAVYAPAVIESVAQEVFDTSQGFRVNYYWQGKKYSDWFAEDVELVSASDDPSLLIKSSLSGLKRGDVVYMNRSMNGTVKDMSGNK